MFSLLIGGGLFFYAQKGLDMLVLKLRSGDQISLIDHPKNIELGTIKRIETSRGETLFGFDFPKSIQILRKSLFGKDAANGTAIK